MSQEPLTHSDRYVRKTNKIILILGIICLFVFLFSLLLLNSTEEPEEEQHYEFDQSIQDEVSNEFNSTSNNNSEIEFDDTKDDERPIMLTPNPIYMGQVVLGNSASNVLTIGTNGKKSIKILSVELEDAPFEGFEYDGLGCHNRELRGKKTCNVTMNWTPTIAANVQNNFKIIWRETNVSDEHAKHDEVTVSGNSVRKEDCNFCDGAPSIVANSSTDSIHSSGKIRYAIGPDGKPIGIIGEDGLVRDFNGNIIGRVDSNGMIVDKDGNIIGVAGTGKLILDENGNVIGYVDENGIAYDNEGNVIGTMLADGTVVDANGNVIGKAVDYGYVYDENGNLIGVVRPDGTVVDLEGNVIGKLDKDGNVVDFQGNIIGHVARSGEVISDANGKQVGVVLPNGDVVDEEGQVVGRLDENGDVSSKQIIGKRGGATRLAYDKDGNVIGYLDEDGNVRDFNGNIIGRVDENGNVVDKNGNIIGKLGDDYLDLALDENGNVIGYIDKNGLVHGADGQIIGYVDENGNIIGNPLQKKVIGKARMAAYDKDGNLIGYVDENGNVIDKNGNIIGHVDANGNIIDKDGNIIGHTGQMRVAYDKDGNVIGYVDENGNVRDFNGNIIGHVDENGNIVDKDGNIIGRVGNQRVAIDENGNIIGYIDDDGNVRDFNGNVIGHVDENGNIIQYSAEDAPIIGSVGAEMELAVDENGNVIGYIDANGNVYDENGNLIGHVDENGNVVDLNGNIIGRRSGKKVNVVYDKDGNIIGYVDENGITRDKYGNIIGIVDAQGNVRAFGRKLIGGRINRNLLPITPSGAILGTINHRGEVMSQGKVVGKIRPDGLVTDISGAKILARGVNPGYIVNWGCDFSRKLDKDGIVRQDGVETDLRVYADGTVWSSDGQFQGQVIETGSVYDNECNYLGEASADGYVRDANKREIGCLNPDGTVLDIEEPRIKGHLVRQKFAVSPNNWRPLGVLEASGILRDSKGNLIGCANVYGDIYDKNMAYLGSVSNAKYALSFDGKFIGTFDEQGNFKSKDVKGAHLIFDTLLADKNQNIIGYAVPEINILADVDGNILGHMFPDGVVYDSAGVVIDKFNGGNIGIYGGSVAKFVRPQHVVGIDGRNLGKVNYDLSVVDFKGAPLGKVNIKGQMFDESGHQIGGIVKQGAARGYNGSYLGYVASTGEVVQLDEVNNNGVKYNVGDITGRVTPDGVVIKDRKIIGEVLPQSVMIDIFGNVAGFSNDRGFVISSTGTVLAIILPGGGTTNNFVPLQSGAVINFQGQIIGTVLPTGQFMDTKHLISGRVMADGKVISSTGVFLGEVVSGDIVIGNDDTIQGLVQLDGTIIKNGNLNGQILTDGLAIDNQKNILGHTFSIGNTILSNSGAYLGRISALGRVVVNENDEIGFIKSNGSFVDLDKNVAGYSLPEVARNRRN